MRTFGLSESGATSSSSNPRHVIIASEVFAPLETATAHILTSIAERLREDFPVRVITLSHGSTAGGESDGLGIRDANVDVVRLRFPRFNKSRVLSRIVGSVWSTFAIAISVAARGGRGDAILAVTNPPTMVPLLALVASLRGARLIVIVHDVFPDNLTAAGASKLYVLVPLLRRFASFGLRRAFTVVVIGRDMGELLESKYGVPGGRIEFIPNWADLGEIQALPAESVSAYAEYGLTGKFVVEFAGNIGRVQGIDNVLEGARLLGSVPQVQLLVVGDGARSQVVRDAIASKRVVNVTYVGSKPREMQNEFLNACHVGLVSLSPGMLGLGVPSKVYNLLAAGKPIIAVVDEDSEIGRLVVDEQVGWVVPPGDPIALANTVREAYEMRELLPKIGARCRRLAESKYSQRESLNRYYGVVKAVFDD